ncbi:ArsR/SmtB family transcription factor [Streptomyces sp. NPDC087422]|uniref:ArsR/SmtB family transcription factor n=1 Tax=Streptomyces sp. NPDC087422 TaxID=3365786 RepID=UPI00382A73E0
MGDIEITDPKAMRALAHPVRLAILEHLQRNGPATATVLAPRVGATPSVTSWHLRHLAGFGLVRDADPDPDAGGDGRRDRRERRWQAVARGFRFEVPEDDGDEEGRSAARLLSREMFLRSADLPARWAATVEPGLDPAWRRLSGLANTRVVVTPEEAAAIEDGIERVLAPYVTRDAADRPAAARSVRLLRYTLPEGEPQGEGEVPAEVEAQGRAPGPDSGADSDSDSDSYTDTGTRTAARKCDDGGGTR